MRALVAGGGIGGLSAAELNSRRMPGAVVAKAFNTLTADYQSEIADGNPGEVAMFYAAEEERAASVAQTLVGDCGFAPVRIGGWREVGLMEAPRRPGAVYGESYGPTEAGLIAAAARAGDLDGAALLADELKMRDDGA